MTIVLFNRCTEPIRLSDAAPWSIRDIASKRIVFTAPAAAAVTVVDPGERRRWTWDQQDNERESVPGGAYWFLLETVNGDTFSEYFEIRFTEPREGFSCAQLNTDQRVYSLGKLVDISFANNCDQPVTLPQPFPWDIIDDRSGSTLTARTTDLVITRIHPGQRVSAVWDQRGGIPFQQVPAGQYSVELETWDAGCYTATFWVTETPEGPPQDVPSKACTESGSMPTTVADFDANANGAIDDAEVLAAVGAWTAGAIGDALILEVVATWIEQRPID